MLLPKLIARLVMNRTIQCIHILLHLGKLEQYTFSWGFFLKKFLDKSSRVFLNGINSFHRKRGKKEGIKKGK